MEAYRDQYATLFNTGKNVVVIGVSADADTTQASWAREKDFPVLFVSDKDGTIGRAYAAWNEQRKMDNRSLFVVGPDGKVTYMTPNFNVLAEQAYKDLADAVSRAGGAAPSGGPGRQ